MAKDYSKIKALAQSILECIGDEPEGEDPKTPKQDTDIDDGGQEDFVDVLGAKSMEDGAASSSSGGSSDSTAGPDGGEGKKKKLSLISSMLSRKFKGKQGQ